MQLEVLICKDWPQMLVILIASLAVFGNVALYNWTSPTIPKLICDEKLHTDIESATNLAIIPSASLVITSVISGNLVDKFGRKHIMWAASVAQLVSCMLVIFANSIYILYISRVAVGISASMTFTTVSIYIAEISTPKVRGTWGNSPVVSAHIGQFLTNLVGYYLDVTSTACVFVSISLIFSVAIVLMPESPYYLVMVNKPEKARRSLNKSRRGNNVDDELHRINVMCTDREFGTYKDVFFIDSNRRVFLIILMARCIQQLSGVMVFVVYNQLLFMEAEGNINEGYSSIIYNGVFLILYFFSSCFMDKLGRKMGMTISCTGCFVALAAEAIYFDLKEHSPVDLSSVLWFPLAGMVSYAVSFSLGLAFIPLLPQSELPSSSVRGKIMSLMTTAFGLTLLVLSKLFQYLMVNFGLSVPYALFAACTFIGIFLSDFFVPAAEGKTLEEIQQILNGTHEAKISEK